MAADKLPAAGEAMMFGRFFGRRAAAAAPAPEAADAADGLVGAFLLDGKGRARALDWAGIAAWTPAQGPLWIHLHRRMPGTADWLHARSGLDPAAAEALLEDDVRPRAAAIGAGVLVSLRGANATPGAEPEDMVAIRAFLEKDRLITTRGRRLATMEELQARFAAGTGPCDSTEVLQHVAGHIVDRVAELAADLDDDTDALETAVLEGGAAHGRQGLAQVRRRAIALRRHMAPQRDALIRLSDQPSALMDERDRAAFRHIAETVARIVEQLDAVRDRATVVQDEVMNGLAERQNRNSYLLAVVAGVFLPLSFVAGLFGTNLSGQPNADGGFWILVGGLGALAVVQIVLFRLLRWI